MNVVRILALQKADLVLIHLHAIDAHGVWVEPQPKDDERLSHGKLENDPGVVCPGSGDTFIISSFWVSISLR